MQRRLKLPEYVVEEENISRSKLKSTTVTPTGANRITPKGVSSSAFQRAWDAGYTGYGAVVAVIDTGVDGNHPDLKKAVIKHINLTNENMNEPHGTHVAGTIAADGLLTGGAPGAKIIDIHVLGKYGGTIASICQAIRIAADEGAHIANMSLGASNIGLNQINQLKQAVQYAWNKGTVCIAAAGNDGTSICTPDPYSYPASVDLAESVAATDVGESLDQITLAVFSNENNEVDIAACGKNVLSTVLGGKYSVFSGTSMATPHVSAMAAIFTQYIKKEFPELRDRSFSEKLVGLLYDNVLEVRACAPQEIYVAGKLLMAITVNANVPSEFYNISFGRGFVRYQPRQGPVVPQEEKLFYNNNFLGHFY